MTDSERLEAIRKAATEHLERALHCLRNMPCGGVGEDGPTLEELDDYVGTHSAPMENDALYHGSQEVFRLIEMAIKEMAGEK